MPNYIATEGFIGLDVPELSDMIKTNTLRYSNISVSHNCCSNKVSKNAVEFVSPKIGTCKYHIGYCNINNTFVTPKGGGVCNVNATISHDCFNGINILLGLFDGIVPIPNCTLSVWVDELVVEVVTDAAGFADVKIPLSGNGTYNIQVTCCDGKTKRFTYVVNDCAGIHITKPYPNPCLDGDFFKIRELHLSYNQVVTQLLKKIYNMRIASDRAELKKIIEKYLNDRCKKGKVDISYTLDLESQTQKECYEITIYDVSNNLLPIKLISENITETCESTRFFTCSHYENISNCDGDQYTRCSELKVSIPLDKKLYRFDKIVFESKGCIDRSIQLFSGTNGYVEIDNTGISYVGNLAHIRNAIISHYSSLSTPINVTVNIVANVLTIKIIGDNRLEIPKEIFFRNITDSISMGYEFVCSKYDFGITDCEWAVEFESGYDCGYGLFGYVSIKSNHQSVPLIVLQDSINLYQESDEAIINSLQNYFTGSTVEITRTDGILPKSIIRIVVKNTDKTPHELIILKGGKKECYKFSCDNLYYTKQIECKNSVTFTESSIYIFPEIFGLEKFRPGVYSFKVQLVDIDGNCTNKEYCVYNGEGITCLLPDAVKSNPETKAVMLHETLLASKDCDQCDCETLCAIYKSLVSELSSSIPKKITEFHDCGC